jgi:hypothetical protein
MILREKHLARRLGFLMRIATPLFQSNALHRDAFDVHVYQPPAMRPMRSSLLASITRNRERHEMINKLFIGTNIGPRILWLARRPTSDSDRSRIGEVALAPPLRRGIARLCGRLAYPGTDSRVKRGDHFSLTCDITTTVRDPSSKTSSARRPRQIDLQVVTPS